MLVALNVYLKLTVFTFYNLHKLLILIKFVEICNSTQKSSILFIIDVMFGDDYIRSVLEMNVVSVVSWPISMVSMVSNPRYMPFILNECLSPAMLNTYQTI